MHRTVMDIAPFASANTAWTHVGTTSVTAFLASLVECVEALTVVLAVGATRGWRSALIGSAAALTVLAAIVAAIGPALARIPLHLIQIFVGALILLFGIRWLRKAILRYAGLIPMHDEEAIFQKSTAAMRGPGMHSRWDKAAFAATFNITMLEGTEVIFIVIALGAEGRHQLLAASGGALAAVLVVVGLGLALHRPLARVPENTFKFAVGILLSALGTFWVCEGAGLGWPMSLPQGDLVIPGLIALYLLIAAILIYGSRSDKRVQSREVA